VTKDPKFPSVRFFASPASGISFPCVVALPAEPDTSWLFLSKRIFFSPKSHKINDEAGPPFASGPPKRSSPQTLWSANGGLSNQSCTIFSGGCDRPSVSRSPLTPSDNKQFLLLPLRTGILARRHLLS